MGFMSDLQHKKLRLGGVRISFTRKIDRSFWSVLALAAAAACSVEEATDVPNAYQGAGSTENPSNLTVSGLNVTFLQEGEKQADSCLLVRITPVDSSGGAVVLDQSQSLVVSASLGKFFDDDHCAAPAEAVTLPAESSERVISFRSEWPGHVDFAVDEKPPAGWKPAIGSVTLLPSAVSFEVMPPDPPPLADTCAPFKATLVNKTGSPAKLTADLPVKIEAATLDNVRIADIQFYPDAGCKSPPAQHVLKAGQSELEMFFRSQHTGKMQLIVTSSTGDTKIGGFKAAAVLNPIEGVWSTGCTESATGQGAEFSLEVADGLFTYLKHTFTSCAVDRKEVYTMRMTGSLRLYAASSSPTRPTRPIDFYFAESCLEPKREAVASDFNFNNRCGHSDWKVGVCQPTTGLNTCEPFEAIRVQGDTVRDRFALEPDSVSQPLLTFTSESLYPGSSLNNSNLRELNVDGITFTRTK